MPELVPFPRFMELQTTTICGAKCRMCPHVQISPSWPNGPLMDEALFRNIIDQCAGQPIQRISPYFMAEPLADRRIFERIAYIGQKLPAVGMEVTCTAQLMSDKVRELLLAAPISELRISSHGISQEDYELLMPGIHYDSAWENLCRFVEAWKLRKPYPLSVVSLFGLLSAEREQAVVDYWHGQGVELSRWRVTSRGRHIDVSGFDSPPDPTRWPTARREPPYACRFARDTEWIHILSDGRVCLCCMDYSQEVILGDLQEQSMVEIWTSPRYTKVRRQIAGESPVPASFLCKRCEWYVSQSALEQKPAS